MYRLLRAIAIDFTPVRRSRKFRVLTISEGLSNLGTQSVLVALPYQIYVLSHSPALVGLLGAFELGPMVTVSLIGGALNDRHDRRMLLAAAQVAIMVMAGALCIVSLTGSPPVFLILVLGGLLAGGTVLDGVSRSAIIPGILEPADLRSGIAFNYGMYQVTGIVGPALGGLLIDAVGLFPRPTPSAPPVWSRR